MSQDDRVIDVATLNTEAGVSDAGVKLAQAACEDMLWPAVHYTPRDRRGDLFERFFCALCGAAIAELGPDRTKEALDAAKLAVDDWMAERAGHAH